jgi:hypothetical protein
MDRLALQNLSRDPKVKIQRPESLFLWSIYTSLNNYNSKRCICKNDSCLANSRNIANHICFNIVFGIYCDIHSPCLRFAKQKSFSKNADNRSPFFSLHFGAGGGLLFRIRSPSLGFRMDFNRFLTYNELKHHKELSEEPATWWASFCYFALTSDVRHNPHYSGR